MLKRRTDEKLGEILLRQGTVAKSELDKALVIQDAEGGLLGEILIKMGCVNERDITKAIITQYGMPYITLDGYDFNPAATELVPEYLAKKLKVVPLDVIADIILIAMSNPLDKKAISDVEEASAKKARVFITVISELEAMIEKVYSKKEE
jgi:type IV pilus assembly protein PilB